MGNEVRIDNGSLYQPDTKRQKKSRQRLLTSQDTTAMQILVQSMPSVRLELVGYRDALKQKN